MFSEKTVLCPSPEGMHEIVYSEFAGDPARTVVCVHGLSRNGRDFDWLAEKLAADGHRVICPDMAGRARSPCFRDNTHYNYPQYISDCLTLVAHLGCATVDWVGTSMGGLIGMVIAAQPAHPINRMVINDIGPFVSRTALGDIKFYVGQNPTYATWDDYYAAFKKRMAGFGLETEEQTRYLADTSLDKNFSGGFRLNYTLDILAGLQTETVLSDFDLWPLWDQVNVPMLLLHGMDSAVLTSDIVERMRIGKNIRVIDYPGVGHAPALMNDTQIGAIADFLR